MTKKVTTILTHPEVYSWIEKWKQEGSDKWLQGTLATVGHDNAPYTRIMAVREMNTDGILFFTQKGSKKVTQIKNNNMGALTISLSKNQRQISFRGPIIPLSNEENKKYWETYPKESQIRFMVYGPTSGQVIADNSKLDGMLDELIKKYETISPNKPDSYIGYRIQPNVIELYQLNNNKISDSFVIERDVDQWELFRVVP